MSWRREGQPTPVFLPGEPPWTEEPGGLQSMGSQRVGHDCAQLTLSYFPTQKEDPPVCLCDVSKHTGSLCVCVSVFYPHDRWKAGDTAHRTGILLPLISYTLHFLEPLWSHANDALPTSLFLFFLLLNASAVWPPMSCYLWLSSFSSFMFFPMSQGRVEINWLLHLFLCLLLCGFKGEYVESGVCGCGCVWERT